MWVVPLLVASGLRSVTSARFTSEIFTFLACRSAVPQTQTLAAYRAILEGQRSRLYVPA